MKYIIDCIFTIGIITTGVVSILKMINILFSPKLFQKDRFRFITDPPNKRQLFVYNLIMVLVVIEVVLFIWDSKK
jgi:hypothetical protein